MTAADAHRTHAARFTELVENTRDWDAPTPVQGWRARDVVTHFTQWLPGMLGSLGVDFPEGREIDPVAAWAELRDHVQALLDDPERASHQVTGFDGQQTTVADLLGQYYVPDVFMHGWDLARATGQDDTLDPDTAGEMVDGMSQQVEMLRESGQFGHPTLLDESHATQDRLIALIGRDPQWQPPAS